MIRKDRVKGKGTTGNQIPETKEKSRGNDYSGKDRQKDKEREEGESPPLKQPNLISQFAEKIFIHLIIGIQNITVLKNDERQRGNRNRVFHGTERKELQGTNEEAGTYE